MARIRHRFGLQTPQGQAHACHRSRRAGPQIRAGQGAGAQDDNRQTRREAGRQALQTGRQRAIALRPDRRSGQGRQARSGRASVSGDQIAHEGGGREDGTWCDLSDGDRMEQLGVGEHRVPQHEFATQKGEQHVAAAEEHAADLREREEDGGRAHGRADGGGGDGAKGRQFAMVGVDVSRFADERDPHAYTSEDAKRFIGHLTRKLGVTDAYVQTVLRDDLVKTVPSPRFQDILDYHSSCEDAGRTAAKAGVRTLVLTHPVPQIGRAHV